MRYAKVAASILLLALIVSPALANVAAACPDLIREALAATDELCEHTARNEACYGHILLLAEPQPGVLSFDFDEPGHRVDVTRLRSLRLSPMQLDSGIWGVALLRLQANLAASETKDVTLLTFGDVQLENAVEAPTQLEVIVAGNNYVSVLREPDVNAEVIGLLAPRQRVTAVERLADNSWLRVEIPDSGEFGWVSAPLVRSAGNFQTLRVSEVSRPYYRSMQAFRFRSAVEDPACPEAPTSGMVIQTPEGVGEVTFLINEVHIRLGSTVFFQAEPGGSLTVSTLEGHASVEAANEIQVAVAGMQVSVPLDLNLKPAGPPSLPQPFDTAVIAALPIDALLSKSTVVIEGTVEAVDGNTITVNDTLVELLPGDSLLQSIEVGVNIRVEGDVSSDGTAIISDDATLVPPPAPPTEPPDDDPPTEPPPINPPPVEPTALPTNIPPTANPTAPPTVNPPTQPVIIPPSVEPTNPPTDNPPTEPTVNDPPPTEPTAPPTDLPPGNPPPTEPTEVDPTEPPTDNPPLTETVAPPEENPPATETPVTPTENPTPPDEDESSGSGGWNGMGMGND